VRGVKGNKVLRTVKIKPNKWTRDTQWEYFCDQTCLMDFIRKHFQEFIRLHPRTECLETPVTVEKKSYENQYYNYNKWNIEVDESRNTG
jgi:hypothetical protein